jgi:hypothetical protein
VTTRHDATVSKDARSGAPATAAGEAAGPVLRWTAPETWLLGELARRALVARIDGGPPRRLESNDFIAATGGDPAAPTLELSFRARDRKSTRLNSSHNPASRMPSSA